MTAAHANSQNPGDILVGTRERMQRQGHDYLTSARNDFHQENLKRPLPILWQIIMPTCYTELHRMEHSVTHTGADMQTLTAEVVDDMDVT